MTSYGYLGTGVILLAMANSLAQPTITKQPADQSVSLGANVTLKITAAGTPPLTYQWSWNDTDIAGATNATLAITNASLASAGNYSVVVTDTARSIASEPVKLDVDTTFTKITAGPVVTNLATGWGGAWGDIDNDGFIDLVVSNEGAEFLYRNNGDGTFSQITSSPVVVSDGDLGGGVTFADYDNDGNLDLVVAGYGGIKNKLFHNNGGGVFTKSTKNGLDADGDAESTNWGDYDNDGYIDLMITSDAGQPNRLYHNNRDGTFTKMTSQVVGDMLNYGGIGLAGVWGDFDNDGDLDMVVTYYGNSGRTAFYRNNGNGTFTRILQGDIGYYYDSAWGDYDNDGDLDIFIAGGGSSVIANNVLYRNNGDSTFTKIMDGPLVSDQQPSAGGAWADYDNDGWLDLFVANPGLTLNGGEKGRINLLYHNNGDGTFTQIMTGSLANDVAASSTGIWGDYDNDGFMDLFVANGGHTGRQVDFLYRNNGNANSWLKLKLIGTTSNRSAIGAKARVKATINGKTFWQMREISGGDGFLSQNDVRPNFGLGDAKLVETVRIEWPSGIVQELHNVPPNQILAVTEPPRLEPTLKVLNGMVELKVRGWRGFNYAVEVSSDFKTWSRIGLVQNLTGTLQVPEPAGGLPQRFYRLMVP